jgi:hypothetical protein
MELLMQKSMEDIAGVFGMGRIQDLLTLLTLLEENGHTLEDLHYYREARMAANAARRQMMEDFQKAFAERARRCPACGAVMHLVPVNSGPRDQVGGGYRSQWICPDSHCMETIYNLETPAAIVRRMGLEPPPRPGPPKRPPKRKPCGGCNGKA